AGRGRGGGAADPVQLRRGGMRDRLPHRLPGPGVVPLVIAAIPPACPFGPLSFGYPSGSCLILVLVPALAGPGVVRSVRGAGRCPHGGFLPSVTFPFLPRAGSLSSHQTSNKSPEVQP